MAWLLAIVLGALAGVIFFGGLWLTIRGLDRSRRPAVRVLGSLVVRLVVVAAAALLVTRLHPPAIVAFLASLLVVRALLRRRLSPEPGAAGSG